MVAAAPTPTAAARPPASPLAPAFVTTKFATLAASFLVDSCSGLSYSFSVWAPHARDVLGLSQARIAACGACLNLGGYFALPAGALYDHWSPLPSGPRRVLWVGAAAAFVGYLGLWGIATGRAAPSYGRLLFFAAVAGNSGVWLDASALVTNVRNFPQDRGTVVGVLKAFLGLSASLWTLPYSALLAPDVDAYLLLLAVAPAAVVVAASLFVNHVPFVEACELEEASSSSSAVAGGAAGGEEEEEGGAREGGERGNGDPPLPAPSAAAARGPYTLVLSSSSTSSSSSSLPLTLRLRHQRRRLLQRLRAALYLGPARRFRATFALVGALALFQTGVALFLHGGGGHGHGGDGGAAGSSGLATRRALFAAALALLAVVSVAPWATAGARLMAEPAAVLMQQQAGVVCAAVGSDEEDGVGGGGKPAPHHRRSERPAAVSVEMVGVRQQQKQQQQHRGVGGGGAAAAAAAAAGGGAAPLAATAAAAGGSSNSDDADGQDGLPLLSTSAGGGDAGGGGGGGNGGAALASSVAATDATADPGSTTAAADGLRAALRMAASPEGALLLLQFAVVSGACLAYLNNLGEIYRSLSAAAAAAGGGGGKEQQQQDPPVGASSSTSSGSSEGGHVLFVSLFSVANAAGRLAGGAAPEAALRRKGTPRPAYLSASSALVAAASALAAAGVAEGGGAIPLAALSLAFGFGFGSTWSLVPAILADVFGLSGFAQNYGLAQLAPAAGGFLLASGLVGRLYDRAADRQAAAAEGVRRAAEAAAAAGDSALRRAAAAAAGLVGDASSSRGGGPSAAAHRCVGSACFSSAFWALGLLCAASAVSTAELARRTRPRYLALGRDLRAAHAARKMRGAGRAATGGGGGAGGGGGGGGSAGVGGGEAGARQKLVLLEEDLSSGRAQRG